MSSASTKLLSTVRRNLIPIGATSVVAATIAFTSYSSARKKEQIRRQDAELAKERHREALAKIEKELSPVSLFQNGAEYLNSLISVKDQGDKDHHEQDGDNEEEKQANANTSTPGGNTDNDSVGGITSIAKSFASLVTGEISESEFNDVIRHARTVSQKGDVNETKSTIELINLFLKKQDEVKRHIRSKGFPDLIQGFDPTAMFYYLENEDAVKNPSWKRRKHRYLKGVDVSVVRGLNDALNLAGISYLNTEEEIKAQLTELTNDGWELIYYQADSLPEKPSHYIAVKKGQSRWSPRLEMLLAVRGTNSVPDLLTDALLDGVDYRGGKAHAGILRSGQYLVEKHRELLLSLLEKTKKKEMKLTLVGHSLGAGAAAIAGIELHNDERGCFNVEVVGFGCPAVLSKDLSEGTKSYVTTVVADSDMIPRTSGETIDNCVLDILEYDWTPFVKRDIEDALREVRKGALFGFLFWDDGTKSAETVAVPRIMQTFVDEAIDRYVKPGIRTKSNRRLDTVLHPPGSCVHFYRDGIGISGSYVPCTFFNEIDISRTMVSDHLISGYKKIFLEIMRSFLADDHFSFDEKQPK